MVKMIATKAHTYGHKTIQAGDEFEVEDAYVPTLISLGRATLKETKKPRPMTAKPAEEHAEEKPKPKDEHPTYKTRDLKADK